MKTFASILLIIFVSATVKAQTTSEDILGKWANPGENTHIEIFKRNDKFFGKIIWLKEPNDAAGKPKNDTENRKAELKSRPLLGLELLMGFVYRGKNIWNSGKVYDPKTGNTYNGKIALLDKNKFNIRTFFGLAIIGRTETWTRVE